ncbi:YggT family protein [Lacticaseibacillus brantae]|uniref:YggT family protein n=1 Tax=Lacticaseibacillus brantae TaxID=943673 RepID=UPI000A83CDB8|nr:YggT family protein [Lacticaseibacillus brantae]
MTQLVYALYQGLSWALYLYMIAIAVYILMTWFPNAMNSRLGYYLGRIVEPYLNLFRRFIPAIMGLDFSPVIAFFVLTLLQRGLNWIFFNILTAMVR